MNQTPEAWINGTSWKNDSFFSSSPFCAWWFRCQLQRPLYIMVSIADIVVNHWKSSPLRASRVPHAMFSCFHPPKHHIPFHLISSHLISSSSHPHLLSSHIWHLISHISSFSSVTQVPPLHQSNSGSEFPTSVIPPWMSKVKREKFSVSARNFTCFSHQSGGWKFFHGDKRDKRKKKKTCWDDSPQKWWNHRV